MSVPPQRPSPEMQASVASAGNGNRSGENLIGVNALLNLEEIALSSSNRPSLKPV
jgi:hypothetical protein